MVSRRGLRRVPAVVERPRGRHVVVLCRTARLCFEEARPVVQGVFLLRMLAGVSFAGDPLWAAKSGAVLWIGIVAKTCAICAVYIYNGITDVEEDRANGSTRPISRGDLVAGRAYCVVTGLGVLALAMALVTRRPGLVWTVGAILAVGWAYSGSPLRLKRYPAGFVLTMVLLTLPTYHAGYVMGDGARKLPMFVFVTCMLLWLALVGQSKDLSDVEGDRKAGRRSLPVVWGQDAARSLISGAALVIGGMFLAVALCSVEPLLAPAVVICVGALSVAVISLGPWSRGNRERCRRPYRAFMLTQYAANVAIIVTYAYRHGIGSG